MDFTMDNSSFVGKYYIYPVLLLFTMSNTGIEVQSDKNSIVQFEDAISKKHIRCYEYNLFSNFQEIGSGGFGKVYRVNWKFSEKPFVLKSFSNFDNFTVKEIIREVMQNVAYWVKPYDIYSIGHVNLYMFNWTFYISNSNAETQSIDN